MEAIECVSENGVGRVREEPHRPKKPKFPVKASETIFLPSLALFKNCYDWQRYH